MPEGLFEIEFFANADDTKMLIELHCSSKVRRAQLRQWSEDFRAALSEIAGVVATRETVQGAAQASEKLVSVGASHLIYQTLRRRRAVFRSSGM